MTTTVTLKTHDWPVRVVTTDRWSRSQWNGPDLQLVQSDTITTATFEVPPHSERDLYITDTRSIQFFELPAPPPAESNVVHFRRAGGLG